MESDLIGTSSLDSEFLGLSDITDPLKSDGHIISFEARDAGVGTNTNSLTVELRQGSTLVASTTLPQNILTQSFELYSYTLSNSEADSITDYSDLQVVLITECTGCTGGSARDRTHVSWVEFKILDNPPLLPPTLNSVTFISGTELLLDFTEPSNLFGINSYDVERDDGSGFTTVANLVLGTTSYLDTDLTPNSFYSYRLRSIGDTETSVASNEINQTTTVVIIESLFARPDSDTGQDWGNVINCDSSTRWECVNELNQDYESSYLESDLLGVSNSDQAFMGLSDIQVPQESLDHIIRFIAKEAGVGSNQPSLLVELRENSNVIASVNLPQGSLTNNGQLFEYTLSSSEAGSITNYNNLEVRLFTECSGCGGQEARDRTHVSWMEFEVLLIPPPPKITHIDTLDSTSIEIKWSVDDLHEHIKRIIIQRSDGGGFVTVGNVTKSTTSFTSSGLNPETIYSFRLIGQGSFTNPSDILQGATPASIESIIGNGTIIEPDATNSLTKLQKEIFAQTIENFNVTTSIIGQINTDFNVAQINAYEVIVKMLDGSYGSSQEILDTGAYYGTRYVENGNIDQFLQTITEEVRTAIGNTTPSGDNPEHGVPDVGE